MAKIDSELEKQANALQRQGDLYFDQMCKTKNPQEMGQLASMALSFYGQAARLTPAVQPQQIVYEK